MLSASFSLLSVISYYATFLFLLSLSLSLSLPISFSPVPPRILHSSSVVLPIRGSNANIDCTAAGSPRPTITWWFGDKLLSLSNKYSIFYNGTLSVQQTIPDDNGAYYCKATNFVGRGQGRSFLIVLDP